VPGFRTEAEVHAELATAGEQRTLAGAAALRPRRDYRTWSLWGVLVLGVALLAWMAWRLGKQVGAAPAPGDAGRHDV
jgi:hypothetical protein